MSDHAHAHAEHEHPTWKQYKWVALILTAITAVEVWVYYIPAFVATPYFVPSLLIMSAIKFIIVVMYYMHLKYDHWLFRRIFVGSLAIAIATLFALLFLFGKMKLGA
jgi:cytochrome c oxidase subunit 4